MRRWKALMVLGTAQFLMVLDTAVMNVSISALVDDFDTDVTAIQAVITLYTLVMAAFMITGGKIGDIVGRRRAFTLGLCVYGLGSGLTALAPELWVLTVGWSIIEGLGAALVLPALAALVAGAYQGRERAVAYGVIGGLAGAGIAIGPLLGGWVTTYLTWRVVFAGEVVIVVVLLCLVGWVTEPPRPARAPRLDGIGAALSALGLGCVVLGILQSSTWGWLRPKDPPFTVFGFAPTLFAVAAGGLLLWLFRVWERRREERGEDPLVSFALLGVPPLRAGLTMLLGQNLVLLGLFFVIPLYLQIVQGLNAFETGLRLLPVSVTMFFSALSGPFLSKLAGPRTIVRIGLLVLLAAILWLLSTIRPDLHEASFAWAMALLGIGMGLLASQLGNVVQSSVEESRRSEAGGLQYTAQNLGSSLGTALIGSLLIVALSSVFVRQIEQNPAISDAVRQQTGVVIEGGISFLSTDQVRAATAQAGVPKAEADAYVAEYADAQIAGLKAAILAVGAITLACFPFTRRLPDERMAGVSASGPS
ncbi:MFS transporter [Streptomyces sp. WAC06614]|uniref:MFS transporter n=1 Tax=Streptomyces sp. WAC06614 TaxID=2487416 RepID=UPI000F7B646A|nr:MFS transporter [Streptomyces sp. WAC06614]RSS80079.1 MFS transporter [Streptomyces sp. WAC06614]